MNSAFRTILSKSGVLLIDKAYYGLFTDILFRDSFRQQYTRFQSFDGFCYSGAVITNWNANIYRMIGQKCCLGKGVLPVGDVQQHRGILTVLARAVDLQLHAEEAWPGAVEDGAAAAGTPSVIAVAAVGANRVSVVVGQAFTIPEPGAAADADICHAIQTVRAQQTVMELDQVVGGTAAA